MQRFKQFEKKTKTKKVKKGIYFTQDQSLWSKRTSLVQNKPLSAGFLRMQDLDRVKNCCAWGERFKVNRFFNHTSLQRRKFPYLNRCSMKFLQKEGKTRKSFNWEKEIFPFKSVSKFATKKDKRNKNGFFSFHYSKK